MRAIKPNTRRRSLWRTVLLAGLAVVIGGGGTVAALAYFKVIDPAKLAFWRSRQGHPAGWIPVPICMRPVPAYTTVTGDYLTDPRTGELAVVYTPPKSIPKDAILSIMQIRDRVTAHEKPALFYFKESDFLPEGTRPGIVGGTPEGKRAITLDAGKLKGVHELTEGDHVDLLASIAVDMPGAGRTNSGRFGTNVLATPDTTLLPKRSFVKALVQDGVVVTPVRTRNVPISSSSLTQGMTTRTMPVQEIVLAVAPEEVAPLAEAMDLKYEITCVARSGRPASHPITQPAVHSSSTDSLTEFFAALSKIVFSPDRTAGPDKVLSSPKEVKTVDRDKNGPATRDKVAMDITPGLDPMANTRYLEVMIGKERQFVLFTGLGNSPVVAFHDDGLGGPVAEPAGTARESKQTIVP
jgi:hypothetical protein